MKQFKIYQLPVEHAAKFMRLSFVKKHNIMPKLEDYKMVWDGEVEDSAELDYIYAKFNIGEKPEGYTGHSLSMSDVVFMDGKYFYCDTYGWVEVFTQPKNEATEHEVTLFEQNIHFAKNGTLLSGNIKIGTWEKEDVWAKQGGRRDKSGNLTVPYLYYITIDSMPCERGKRIFFSRKEIKQWLDGKKVKVSLNLLLANIDNNEAFAKIIDFEKNGTRCAGETPAMKVELAEARRRKQYTEFKAKNPNALLLFRCGDFYETYFDDAITVSKVLGITLTYNHHFDTMKGHEMAGFPHHALDIYLPKLIRAGHKCAIIEDI